MIGETITGKRLCVKKFVAGLECRGEAAACPFSALNHPPAANDEIGGDPVLVMVNSGTGASAAFSHVVDGRTSTFSPKDSPVLLDAGTESRWGG